MRLHDDHRPRRHDGRELRRAPAAAGVLVALLALAAVQAASPPASRAAGGMVASPEPLATRVGVDVLREGGNAVDAAVAVAATLAVTHPNAGNLGGGGFVLVRDADGTYHALDHREVAPAALTPEAFLDPGGRADRERSREGGLAIGVPGSARGLHELHRRFGSKPWKRLLTPAVRYAERGFPVSDRLHATLERSAPRLAADPEARRIFTMDGVPLPVGHRLVQRDLGRTLRRLARRGPDAVHGGEVGRALAATVRAAGGVMTEDDLRAYRPVWREPLAGSYRGRRVVTFPPPSSGGVALLQMLAMLERFDLEPGDAGSSRSIHRMAEAARRAYADRARWLGDPEFADVPVDDLLAPAYLADRAATIDDHRATPSAVVRTFEAVPVESPDTLHFSIVDRDGRAVAFTTTLNSAFGAAIVAPGTGVLLNNEIDDFSLAPGVPDQYGLVGGDANAVRPGKRPLSSMTPTIVEDRDGAVALVLGAPGGSRIITSVLQVVVHVIDHGMELQAAVDAPRFHHQWMPDALFLEPDAAPTDVRRALRSRGHELRDYGYPPGRVQAVARGEDGVWLGAVDPRGGGEAAGPGR